MPEHEALVAGYLGEKRRVADLDKWAARFSSTNCRILNELQSGTLSEATTLQRTYRLC
jgi:hypothetical protein